MTAPITLYPAIDLKDGACVRLRRGEIADATIYSDDPGAQAASFEAQGCRFIHVVDLNGAFAGRSENHAAVRAILAAVKVPVQLGGGLRDLAAIESWLAAGIRRVILGSAAVKNPGLVREAAAAFPGQVAVGIDARDGLVATEGWAETSNMAASELARRLEDIGVTAIIYTDISRDGMLSGLNLDQTFALAAATSIPVIASGGVGSEADLVALRDRAAASKSARVEGVIVGRAIYDGKVGVKSALAILAGRAPC